MFYESLSISKPANKAAQNEEERNMQMRKQTSSHLNQQTSSLAH
jgi:hypothetical protein